MLESDGLTSRCTDCGYRFSVHEMTALCPRCGRDRETDHPDGSWTSIARLTNLAEVGYFADLLESEGFPTRVQQHHEFSALDGSWHVVLVLQVPRHCSPEAIRRVQDELHRTADVPVGPLLAKTGDTEGTGTSDSQSGRSGSAALIRWSPLICFLLVGGAFYAAGPAGRDRPRPGLRDAPSLSDVLNERGQIFTTNAKRGQPRSLLLCDPPSRTIWLQDDLDGDGRFDRVRGFRDGKLTDDIAR